MRIRVVPSRGIALTTILSGVTYDPFGPATGWTWGNGTTESRTFDQDGNPSQIVAAGVTNGYAVDNASRITGISDSGLASNSFTFGYDALDRVTSGTSSTITRGYTYDASSNRLTTTGTQHFTDSIAPTSNQLNSTGSGLNRTYGYDAAGNTTSYTGSTFNYNQRGRISSRVVSAGTTVYYYNALGKLVEKNGNGGIELQMYDEAGHLVSEYGIHGALIEETIWMDDTPVAVVQPSGTSVAIYYVHTDHLNTPRKITRPSDNGLMWRWDPDTFGSLQPNSNPAGLGAFTYNLRFPGQYFMNESWLVTNGFRTYDPTTGRYLESDPIGLQGGINTYAYAGGNPISNADPFGLCWFYYQSTGQLLHVDINGYADYATSAGYSGYGSGLNNPAMQDVQAQQRGDPAGPIPQGRYSIGLPHRSPNTGPGVMNLTPQPGTNAFNRKYLEIHGDNGANNHTASTGCIVEGPKVRNQIANSNDNCLQVMP